MKISLLLCSAAFIAADWVLSVHAQVTSAHDFFEEPVGLSIISTDLSFSCSNITLFQPSITNFTSAITGFPTTNTTYDCNEASLGAGSELNSCKWIPQTFLGMMYDRGIELLRRNIPQRDAFQIFEHTRLVLLQYKVCKSEKIDGTVDIPFALEALHGFIFAKIRAKHAAILQPPRNIDFAAERLIQDMRSRAVMADLTLPFPLSVELTPNDLNTYSEGITDATPSPVGATSSAALQVASSINCTSDFPNESWILRQYPVTAVVDPEQNCCAESCGEILDTVGVSPASLMLDTCCMTCNKYDCGEASPKMSIDIAQATTLQVPSLQATNITETSIVSLSVVSMNV